MTIHIRHASRILPRVVRSFATIAPPSSQIASTSSSLPAPPTAPSVTAEHEGPLRPHLKVPVNPYHGLYGFFRRKTDRNSHTKPREDGQPEYVAVDPPTPINSGRSWATAELRRKSFTDLHTLWYVLLRERNLLVTQKVERSKYKSHYDPMTSEKARDCRKSMARIKAVFTERRNAYIQAARLRRVLRRNPELLQRNEKAESQEGMFENEPDGGNKTATNTQ